MRDMAGHAWPAGAHAGRGIPRCNPEVLKVRNRAPSSIAIAMFRNDDLR
jgi:hypothetical protein